MGKHLLLSSLLVFTFHFSFSQAPLVKQWDKTIGGLGRDWGYEFQQTKDGGYILGGQSFSGISGEKTQDSIGGGDYWIVKIDATGNKQWDKSYGGTGSDVLLCLTQTSDKGYILGGHSASAVGGDKTQANWDVTLKTSDCWIIKIDSSGNKQWDKTFGGTAHDVLWSIHQTTDEGYILGAHSNSGISGDKSVASRGSADYWVIKIDSVGTNKWDKDYGGTSADYLHDLQPTFDGGYILCGNSLSQMSGDKTQNNWSADFNDYWIVKIDSLGVKQWDKRFGGTGDEWLPVIRPTSDNGYIIAGESGSGISGDKTQSNPGELFTYTADYWMIKINSAGVKQWDKRFGGTDDDRLRFSIQKTSDKGFVMGGLSFSGIGGDKTEQNLGTVQPWIVKTDSTGKKLWDKTIFTTGGVSTCRVIQTIDNGYAVASVTDANIGGYKTQDSRGNTDIWIIKFKDSTSCTIIPGIIAALHDTVCPGAAPVLTVTGSSGTAQWQYSSGTNNFTDLTGLTDNVCLDAPPQTGYYRAYSKNAACPDTSAAYKIEVIASPQAAFTKTVTGLTAKFNSGGSSGGVTDYYWDFGDGTYSTLPNPVHTYSYPDTFYVCLTVYNGIECPSLICHDVLIDIPTVTSNLNHFIDWKIYPNPVQESLTIGWSNYQQQGVVGIYNSLGQLLYKNEINSEQIIPVAHFPEGNYFITLQTSESVEAKKFMVVH